MPARLALVEFPADDAKRARKFWSGLLDLSLQPREATQGEGWQSEEPAAQANAQEGAAIGVHERGRGPGDSFSLPYFEVHEMEDTLAQIQALGGSVVHRGERWSICKDSEGNPFGLELSAGT